MQSTPLRSLLLVSLLSFASAPMLLGGTPPDSRIRGDRLDALRATLEQAGEALQSGDTGQAGRCYTEVIETLDADVRPSLLLARAVDGLADVRRVEGRLDQAETGYLRAAELWAELLGDDQPRLAVTLHNLAAVRMARGDLAAAEAPLKRALEIFDRMLGAASSQANGSRRALAELERRRAGEAG